MTIPLGFSYRLCRAWRGPPPPLASMGRSPVKGGFTVGGLQGPGRDGPLADQGRQAEPRLPFSQGHTPLSLTPLKLRTFNLLVMPIISNRSQNRSARL